MSYQARPMVPPDIGQVSEIEREAFPTQLPHTNFQRELGNRLASYIVASEDREDPPPVLGFAGLWFILDEAHLTSIAVRESHRRHGIGELLLISALELAVEKGAQIMTLEVRVSNSPAQGLYEKYGFSNVGVRRGYYTDNNEDAFLMSTDRITSASYQASFQRLKECHSQKWAQWIGPPHTSLKGE